MVYIFVKYIYKNLVQVIDKKMLTWAMNASLERTDIIRLVILKRKCLSCLAVCPSTSNSSTFCSSGLVLRGVLDDNLVGLGSTKYKEFRVSLETKHKIASKHFTATFFSKQFLNNKDSSGNEPF